MGMNEVIIDPLEQRITDLRRQMIHVGMMKGLDHPDTLKFSQQLDAVLNKYAKMGDKVFRINQYS